VAGGGVSDREADVDDHSFWRELGQQLRVACLRSPSWPSPSFPTRPSPRNFWLKPVSTLTASCERPASCAGEARAGGRRARGPTTVIGAIGSGGGARRGSLASEATPLALRRSPPHPLDDRIGQGILQAGLPDRTLRADAPSHLDPHSISRKEDRSRMVLALASRLPVWVTRQVVTLPLGSATRSD
jgi:hypothetical protein